MFKTGEMFHATGMFTKLREEEAIQSTQEVLGTDWDH